MRQMSLNLADKALHHVKHTYEQKLIQMYVVVVKELDVGNCMVVHASDIMSF